MPNSTVAALEAWGSHILNNLATGRYQAKIKEANLYNRWFTPANVEKALQAIAEQFLDGAKLRAWSDAYHIQPKQPRQVGIVMAGNIPLVGFHDLLAVLVSGHHAMVKLSEKDDKLLPFLLKELSHISPELAGRVTITPKLKGFDAVIATGSNNTSRYFHYYFGEVSHIIRKNRNAVGVLTGDESREELHDLAVDIFRYFGLGCRNVSKLYVPAGYDFMPLMEVIEDYRDIINHKPYENNYLYNKSFMVMNNEAFMDTGFFMVREAESLASPIGMLHYSYYHSSQALTRELDQNWEAIQCVVGASQAHERVEVLPGAAQQPSLWDYPDRVDTMAFLQTLEQKSVKAS